MSCPRLEREQLEHLLIGPYGVLSEASRGRLHPEAECDIRPCFQRDIDRITHSKAFRRLKHKTQVFLQPEGDHYRTRLTHTLEVTRLARTVARALRLNEDLAEAIALGHDLGHTPFGHAGEKALSQITGKPFRHNEQSLRVVDKLENEGAGINLTFETRMGIVGHTGDYIPETLEGQIIRFADRIAYLNHDIDDAMRGGILCEKDIPHAIVTQLGDRHSRRINTLVEDVIYASAEKNTICMTPEIGEAMQSLREFMFEHVYRNPKAKGEESKAREIIMRLYEYYAKHPEKLPQNFLPQLDFEGTDRAACDYIAGMTDKYAVSTFTELFIPMSWQLR